MSTALSAAKEKQILESSHSVKNQQIDNTPSIADVHDGYEDIQYQYDEEPIISDVTNHRNPPPKNQRRQPIFSNSHCSDSNVTVGFLNLTKDKLREEYPGLESSSFFDRQSDFALSFLTMGYLSQMEAQAQALSFSNSNSSKSLEDTLKLNEKKVKNNTHFPAQNDNLTSNLHDVRFTRFPLLPAVKLFQIASSKMSSKQIPIMADDFSHLRLSTQIPTQAFVEAANLGSQKITLRYFAPSNFSKISSGVKSMKFLAQNDCEDPAVITNFVLDDIADLKEFKSAWFWFRTLHSRIFPIDRSNESIDLFLLENNYFQNSNCDYRGLGRGDMNAGKFCSQLCDYLIRLNRCRFERSEPFLTTPEIGYQFESFCRGKKEFQDLRMSDSSNRFVNNKNSNQSRSQTASKRNYQGQKLGTNKGQVCQYYNEGSCTRFSVENGKKCRGKNGYVRMHICSFEVGPNVCCGGDHKIADHPSN